MHYLATTTEEDSRVFHPASKPSECFWLADLRIAFAIVTISRLHGITTTRPRTPCSFLIPLRLFFVSDADEFSSFFRYALTNICMF